MAARFDPGLAEFIRIHEAAPMDSSTPLDVMRAKYTALARCFDQPQPPNVRAEDVMLAGPAGTVPARIYRPRAGRLPVVMYFHGGGFMLGGPDAFDSLTADLAADVDAVVVSVDYRLTPEHRFPAAFDDGLQAVRAIAARTDELRSRPRSPGTRRRQFRRKPRSGRCDRPAGCGGRRRTRSGPDLSHARHRLRHRVMPAACGCADAEARNGNGARGTLVSSRKRECRLARCTLMADRLADLPPAFITVAATVSVARRRHSVRHAPCRGRCALRIEPRDRPRAQLAAGTRHEYGGGQRGPSHREEIRAMVE